MLSPRASTKEITEKKKIVRKLFKIKMFYLKMST